MRIRVHMNIKKGCFVVTEHMRNDRGNLIWKKTRETDSIALADCTPIASDAGAKRIRANNSKEVVAKIEGVETPMPLSEDLELVRYNPYLRDDFFYASDGQSFQGSKACTFEVLKGDKRGTMKAER